MEKVQTLAIIKPDAVRNKTAGKILSMIEDNGFEIVQAKMVRLTRDIAGEFYAVHKGKPFYEELLNFMSSGPIIVMVLAGEDAISRWRELMGATNPEKAAEGTVRKLYATSHQWNAVHGSDAPETARQEISFFFSSAELLQK